MTLDNIRVTQHARDQLITLKRRTGVAHWNVLCRWALCRSLAEPNVPPTVKLVLDSNVEMSWRTFAGDQGEIYWALIRVRCHADGFELDEETLAQQFRLHLHRGIGYLIGDTTSSDITALARMVSTTS